MSQAKNAGFVRKNPVEGNKDDIVADLDIERAMQGPVIEPVTDPGDLEKLARDEKFMQDVLDVTFAEPRDENDFLSVYVNVNGVQFAYPRNQSVCKVPRYVLEVLARSRIQRVQTKETRLDDGARAYKPVVTESVTYPFAVIHDPAGPRGRTWLQRLLDEKLTVRA